MAKIFRKIHIGLDTLDDDTLICVFAFLSVLEILNMRQTCKRLSGISKLRIIWLNACTTHVLERGFPFPATPLDTMDSSELEGRTRHADNLATKWLSSTCEPRKKVMFDAPSTTSVSDIRFVPGHDGRWLLTVSKGIWSAITIWDTIDGGLRKLSEWSPKSAIFNSFALNSDPLSEATLAVSISKEGFHSIEILSLKCERGSSNPTFKTLSTIETSYRHITINGDLLAFSDDCAETVIWDWKEKTYAALRHFQDEVGVWQHDRCIQIIFAYQSILVVRARSIHLFPRPILGSSESEVPLYGPIARHSFGWIDGVSVAVGSTKSNHRPACSGDPQPFEPLSILIRSESDDPWASDAHSLDLYKLEPNPFFVSSCISPGDIDMANDPPYIFPPSLASQVPSVRGPLRCSDVILGSHGTAVWIHPADRAASGLITTDIHDVPLSPESPAAHESLVAAVFPGPLNPAGSRVEARTLWSNSFNNWTSMDYDEQWGRIALGSSYGGITILEL